MYTCIKFFVWDVLYAHRLVIQGHNSFKKLDQGHMFCSNVNYNAYVWYVKTVHIFKIVRKATHV